MNQFSRFELLIGKDKFQELQTKKILVLGLGGVGSYVVESLMRSGITNITLVDYDTIDITNLNRQLMTDLNNINKFKTEVLKTRINNINPNCQVTTITEKITKENIELLFQENIDYLIDCCDTTDTKKTVILTCLQKNINFITCMGTGNKLNPEMFEIADIRKTSYDPLAKNIRKWVIDNKIKGKIKCCYSKEQPIKTNSKTIGSTSFTPAVAGLLITSKVIKELINM